MKYLIAAILISFIFASGSQADEVSVGYSYRLANGKLDTTSGESIANGTHIIIESKNSWSVSYRVINDVGEPVGPVYVSSKQWVEASIVPLTIDDIVGVITQSSSLMKEPANPTEICLPKERELAVEEEVQSQDRAPASIDSKSIDELDQYFACYQKSDALTDSYHNAYKETLAMVSDKYEVHSADGKSKEEVSTLMSCLIFRESAHWEAGSSDRGAVGLGQFTSDAINQVKNILNYRGKDNFDQRIQTQRDEHKAGRLSQGELSKNLEMIENERKNYERMTELQRLWASYPLQNRPSANQIDSRYMANKSNHQAVIALSSLMLRECEIRFKKDNIEMDAQMSLFACAGAYNIGYAGFLDNAINRKGEQSLDIWLENLRDSGHKQRLETMDHLISIKRCMEKGSNYAPCGTSENYCTGLPKANACADSAMPLCVGECSR